MTDRIRLSAGGEMKVAFCDMIDIDHYLDDLTVEGQWRRSSLPPARSPSPFHRTDERAGDTRRGLATLGPRRLPRWGLLHLLLDVLVNGEQVLLRPILFSALPTEPGSGSLANISSLGSPSPPTSEPVLTPLTILIIAADRGLRALMRSDSALACADACAAIRQIIVLTFAMGNDSEAGVEAKLFSAVS